MFAATKLYYFRLVFPSLSFRLYIPSLSSKFLLNNKLFSLLPSAFQMIFTLIILRGALHLYVLNLHLGFRF